MEYLDFDGYFYSSDFKVFKRYAKGKEFCDCDGYVYQVVGKVPPKQWWRKTFRFIPNLYKEKLIYRKTGKRMELDELRNYVINRVRDLSENDFTNTWVKFLENANSHEEIINGEIK